MIGLIQRVSQASVIVEYELIGEIETGILLLLGVEKDDSIENVEKLLDKIINFRIFEDDDHKMNLSLLDTGADLLIVPQFTLAANTQKGTRPSFASAAPPELAKSLYEEFVELANNKLNTIIATGEFGANMQVRLINSGPATFWLQK